MKVQLFKSNVWFQMIRLVFGLRDKYNRNSYIIAFKDELIRPSFNRWNDYVKPVEALREAI